MGNKNINVDHSVCKKCIYHSMVGFGERYIACVYAIRTGRCRTLEPGYEEGKCMHFIEGNPIHERPWD